MLLLRLFFSFLSLYFFLLNSACAEVEEYTLDNGLTVLIEPMPGVETVSLYAYVKAGSALEGKYLGAGISHYVEHMLFKGTAKRKAGEIASEVKNLGGNINAHTSFDYTMYTLDLPSGKELQGLDILSDMLMNASFDEKEVENERPVIYGEMRLYEDRPDRFLSDQVYQNAYLVHPYRYMIIGYRSLFDQVKREELNSYYKDRYVPNNIIFSVAGAVDSKEMLPKIKEAFKGFKASSFLQRLVPQEPLSIAPRLVTKEYPTKLYRFSLSFLGVGVLDKDLFALDALSMALGQGTSSRLYRSVYQDKKLVESISASNFTPIDRGLFEIEGVMTKDNLRPTLKAIGQEIKSIALKGLTPQELDKTKRQVMAQFVYANQTSHGRAYRNATDEAMFGDPSFSKQYVQAISELKNEDIKRVARQYLDTPNYNLVYLTPKDEHKIDAPAASFKKDAVERVVLSNGLTLLLKEDHTSPVVAVQLVLRAGTRQEDERLNGITELTSRVWQKATKQMNDKMLSDALEQKAISLSSFGGRNSIGLNMSFLSDQTAFALKVFSGLLENPAFSLKMIDQEKERVLTEIEAQKDEISSYTYKQLWQTLYLKHPYRLDRLGTKESINRISQKDIINYYQRFALASNMVVAVAGDINKQEIIKHFNKGLNLFTNEAFKLETFNEQLPDKTRRKELLMDKQQAMVTFAFMAPGIKDPDRIGMEAIDAILGAGLSGRLFVKVRDQLGKAYTVGCDYVPGIDTGFFSIHVLTSPDKAAQVEELILKELNDLQVNLISEEELLAVKNYLKGTLKMGLDTNAALVSVMSLNELYGLGYDWHERYPSLIDKVGVEDIRRLSKEYLNINHAAVVITNSKKKD